MSDAPQLVSEIKSQPHWHVVIRPDAFVADRIAPLSRCWELLEACRVSWVGWDYPHVDRNKRAQGSDWIASWADTWHLEYWRFYQSAAFIHRFIFADDLHVDEARKRVSSIFLPDDFEPKGYIAVTSIISVITKIFEFAARLANRNVVDSNVIIQIAMNGILDRILFVWDFDIVWTGCYRATTDRLDNVWKVGVEELIGDTSRLSRTAAEWFLERFNFTGAEFIARQQQRLLERGA